MRDREDLLESYRQASTLNIKICVVNYANLFYYQKKLHACWHERLQHLTDKAMKLLALQKAIPRNTANVVKPPPRTACVFP